MSLKLKMLAGLAALGLAGGGAAIAMPHAQAMTQHCDFYCATMSTQAFGDKAVISAGKSIVLSAPGFNPNEDFIGHALGTAANLAQIHQVPASEVKLYADEAVYEFGYAPHGVLPTQCLGASGSAIVLQSCGLPTTLWIEVHRDSHGFFSPFVNVGASASSIKVLTATSAHGPLSLSPMLISGGVVSPTQMWESQIGIYGTAIPWPVPGSQPSFLER